MTYTLEHDPNEAQRLISASSTGKLRGLEGVIIDPNFQGEVRPSCHVLDLRIIQYTDADEFVAKLFTAQTFRREIDADPDFQALERRWRIGLKEIQKALEDSPKDVSCVAEHCHRLRGTAENFGELGLSIIANEVLRVIRAQDATFPTPRLWQELKARLEDAMERNV
ncbi:MAG: hypothetical protein KDB07_03945 [Planctomycetes bacterium]|nr:hypothetical protein [Planctomycetota bacterium]